jgi:hypothetical protein
LPRCEYGIEKAAHFVRGFSILFLFSKFILATIGSSMGFFYSKPSDEIVAVLDISSGGVSGAIVLKNPKNLPFILATASKNFSIRDTVDAVRLEREMLGALDQVCGELQQTTMIRPTKIYCVLATPWSHGELRTVSYKREHEFQFTELFAQKLIAEEVGKFQTGNSAAEQIIDRKITQVSLNGYSVKSPHGQKTRSVVMDVFLSVSLRGLVRNLEDKIHKTFKSKILFTSQMMADFVFARDHFGASDDFLVLDVGAELTEVMFSKAGFLGSTAFFPHGTNTIIRNMAGKLNKSHVETQSLFRLHDSLALHGEAERSADEAVVLATQKWLAGLKKVLLEIVPNRHMPHKILLVASGGMSGHLALHLSSKHIPEFTTGNTNFDVTIGDTKTLHDFYDKAEHAQPDPAIVIKALYINQM